MNSSQTILHSDDAEKSTKKQTAVTGHTIHVVIIDGTMSTLSPGLESNAGLAAKLLYEMGNTVSVHYEPGLQWTKPLKAFGVLAGRGINQQIRDAYGYLASRYRPGDKIFLLGFSRGAYAVRSLAGIIDMIGLLRAEEATTRNIRTAYRHYECTPSSDGAQTFARKYCHEKIAIEMIGVWDTVKSLGLNAPVLWRLSVARNAFHNHELGKSVKQGFQALAHDENRVAYSPVMWDTNADWPGHVEQMWFRGAHGDIGGHLGRYTQARPLANISLVWILEKAESCGLPLPPAWQTRFPQDANAPSIGTWRGLAGLLIMRKKRIIGMGASENMHSSVANR